MEIDRRTLMQIGAAMMVPACRSESSPNPSPNPSPVPTSVPADASVADVTAHELEEATIADLQTRLASKQETSRSLVAKYRARIEALDRAGPQLRAVLELDPDVDAMADKLDAERAAGKLRGPLHGIPILVKDNIDTTGKLTTTAGSLALEGTTPPKDAFVIARLRDAGAIILGKTNLSEWANLRGSPAVSGWSGRGGQTKNPYALDRTPSGSSSGSAVATAANLCAASLGTETDGSITSPASMCSLAGIKPTVGLVSRNGVIPISASQDTVGPIARSVADCAALLTVLAALDPDDPKATQPVPGRPTAPEDYTKALDPKVLAGVRLGVPRKGFFGTHRGLDAVMTVALAKLKELGAVLVDPVDFPPTPDLALELDVLMTEMKAQLASYLATRGNTVKVHSLADVIAFDNAHADREMPLFGQELFEQAQAKGSMTDPAYLAARAKCVQIARTQVLDKLMRDHQLDAFVAATGGPPWLIDPILGDTTIGPNTTQLPAVAGYPHVTVPMGWTSGLPLGLSFFGKPWSEGKLLAYAFAFEQATHHRKPPQYLPSAKPE
ncbi:MAG TPA: amidase [Kofleriaceae bacterium]|jgi:amidase